jgi:hypothetical protein
MFKKVYFLELNMKYDLEKMRICKTVKFGIGYFKKSNGKF